MLTITSREVNEARGGLILAHRPCAFEGEKKRTKNTKKSAPPKTHHEIHSLPDRDQLETARGETRPTR